jgi:tetratricopeptide (TPR) repeat protein
LKNQIILNIINLGITIFFLTSSTLAVQKKSSSGVDEAEALFKQGNLTAAKGVLQYTLRQQPNSVDALTLLAHLLLVEDDFENAIRQVRQALKISPNNPKALATYGHCLFREGEFELAGVQFRKSLRLDSKQATAHLGLGRLLLTKLKSGEALESLQQAITLAPDLEDSYFFASEAYGAAKNLSMQIQSLKRYLALKPKFRLERVQNAEALLKFFRSFEHEQVAQVNDRSRSFELEIQPFYGLMLVEGDVNGKGPYRFLVDSGATSTVLSNSLLDQLNITPISTAVVKCVGGNGKTATKLCKVAKLQVGELEFANLPVSSFDNTIFAGLIDGVLSTADLADFIITLDYTNQKIILSPRSSGQTPARTAGSGHSEIKSEFRFLGNLLLVPVSINHLAPKNFLFDTGAVTSTLSKRAAALLGVHEDTADSRVDIQFAGACGVTQSVLSVSNVNLTLSGSKLDYGQILAVELKEISKEIQTEVSGILGGDFYSKHRVTLDYYKTTITIE